MVARRTLCRVRAPVLLCTLLAISVGCDIRGPKPASRAPGHDAAAATTAAPDGVARGTERREPARCPSKRMGSWTVHDIATVSRGPEVAEMPPQVVVSRTGTATVAWTAGSYSDIGTAEDPPVPGDPQDPTHGVPASAHLAEGPTDQLGIDAAGHLCTR